MIKVQIISWI